MKRLCTNTQGPPPLPSVKGPAPSTHPTVFHIDPVTKRIYTGKTTQFKPATSNTPTGEIERDLEISLSLSFFSLATVRTTFGQVKDKTIRRQRYKTKS